MNQCCLICNNRAGLSLRNAASLFGEHNTLQSGKKLSEVLSQIVDKPLVENKIHSNVLCKKCLKLCSEYDLIFTRLQNLKEEISNQFKESLVSNNLNYDNLEPRDTEKATIPSPIQKLPVLSKKLVLPASKLQPVTPELLLKVGQLPSLSKCNVVLPHVKPTTASTLNLKVTVGTSVLTQTIKTTTKAIEKPTSTKDTKLLTSFKDDVDNMVMSQTHVSPKTSILNFKSLPKNFLSEAVLTKIGSDDDDDIADEDIDKGNDDDQSMEIDEGSLSLVPVSTAGSENLVLKMEEVKGSRNSESSSFLNMEDLTEEQQKYIMSKLQILETDGDGTADGDDDDDQHTIVVDGENGSILRMVSGQKFIYEGGEISLVMADDEQQEDDSQRDLNDEQDSNDETAIELQMAGDEETAKAILAAAQEKGGAFIKVESGEMFRVQRLEQRQEDTLPNLVARVGNMFKCLLCDNIKTEDGRPNVTGDATAMMRHLKRLHDARLYICQFCSAIMRKRTDYTTHIAEHASKLKPGAARAAHACSTCGKSFGSRALLLEHGNMHAGLRPYCCELCHKTFASKYTHQAHLKTHANRPRPYKCDQCGKSFLTQQNLTQHEKTHSGVRDFICSVCDKAFSTQHNLEVHGVVHSGNKAFACDVCGKAFARRAELRDHLRTHTGERPFPCDICGARFTQRSNLHSHRRATHLDDKRYHCSQCPKRFKRRRLLEYHIKAAHTGERPLKCKVCPASFVYPEHYKKHLRIHSGEQPYGCEICGKTFNSRDNRNTHRFIHSDKKPYECVACGAGFMRKQLLYAHMNTSGHLAESIVVNQPRVIKVTENVPMENHRSDLQSSDKFDTIFETDVLDHSITTVVKSESLDRTNLICNIISEEKLQEAEKATLSLIQDGEDPNEPTLLTIHNLVDRSQGTILEAVSADQLNEQTEIVANDENGGVVRLIQIKLPDGNNGWVALNR